MNLIPAGLSRIAARQALVLSKNSPNLMFGVGVVGVVTAGVLACRATLKLEETLYEGQKDRKEIKNVASVHNGMANAEEINKNLTYSYIKTGFQVFKLYAPAIAVGGLSVGLLSGAHITLNRRNVGLTAAYAGLEKSFGEYRSRVAKELGEDRERELHYSTACEIDDEDGAKKSKERPRTLSSEASEYAQMFDHLNPNWSRDPGYNSTFLRAMQEWANKRLTAKGHLFLSDVYDSLGIEQTPASRVVGWIRGEGDDYVDFGLGNWPSSDDWVNGAEQAVILDFNVDGIIYDRIGRKRRGR